MNRIHRIVWNKARQCLVVVGENARTAVKSSGATMAGFDLLIKHWCRTLAAVMMLMQVGLPPFALAQTVIKPDGRTQTTVGNSGPVYNVSTATVTGSNAFNSFTAFSVGAGNTVNLHVPSSAINLINIVRDQRTDIYGILNAIKDGRIGGNVWFANPNGFVVGASGVVNVGSLTVATPTRQFVDGFFTTPGSPDQSSVTQLLSGTAPGNSAGLVSIQGQINAIDGIRLSAGAINVAGSLYSGARFIGNAPDFTDVVNANGLVSANNVVVREGRIEIVADTDVTISGTLAAPGGSGVRGGDVIVRAGGNVALENGALVSVRGNGDNSAGGSVNIWAENNAVARIGALVDASAGASGDGGAIEFSAKNNIELAGGEFRADGMNGGKAGSVLIDPGSITVSADILRSTSGYGVLPDGGSASSADLTLQASESITINDNVTVSTRSVAGTTAAAHANGLSTGNSGNLNLEASTIALKSGSKLLAQADGIYSGGDITLKATRSWTGESKVSVDGATIKGKNVSLTAATTYDDNLLTSWLPVSVPVAVSTVEVKSGYLEAAGNLTLSANSLIDVSSTGLSPLGIITAVSTATVDVSGASVLKSGSDSKLDSSSIVKAKATPGGPNPGTLPADAGVAVNVIVSTSKAHVGDSSTVNATGALEVSAKNAVTATTKTDATAGGAVGIGGTLALSEVTTVTLAGIDGTAATQSNALKVSAESANTVTTSAKAAAKGAAKQTAAQKTAAPSKTEETLAKYKDQASTADGGVEVAAAVAVANVNSVTQAFVASSNTQTASGAAEISSKATTASTVTADGSSVSSTVGVGAAVGLNIGVLVNQAKIADNSAVNSKGLTVGATMTTDSAKNNFVSTATSGAGASDVGVAGSLAANVLVNTTTATLEGDLDHSGTGASVNAGTGDIVVQARNASISSVKSSANIKPASVSDPAEVGVGASVGLNVAVNTTLAEIENGAKVSGGNDLDLIAKSGHTLTTTVTGGAAGADISVTPVAAVTVAVNTTSARLGSGDSLLLAGAYTSSAEQSNVTTTTATGATEGNKVAVGASIALSTVTDTVVAEIDRDIDAAGAVGVEAKSISKSTTTATASVKGGQKADANDKPAAAASGGTGTAAKSVDEQVKAQGDAAKDSGKKTAAAAPAAATPATSGTAAKLDSSKDAPKTEDSTQSGGVSVAAAVGVNIGVATTTASIAKGRKIKSGGATSVTSTAQMDAAAKADGSQVNSGDTDVGIGAAVALNTAVATNIATIGDNAEVMAKGVTVSALMPVTGTTTEKNDFGADAKSGAGAGNVGVAGSLAANVVVNTTIASIQGDTDTSGAGLGHGASVNAGGGNVAVQAQNLSISTVKSGADVKTGSASEAAAVGVGASVGMNVAVNTTTAEVGDSALLTNADDVGMSAKSNHTLTTAVTGGASGANVSVTPLAAVTLAVNTTTARLGSGSQLTMTGDFTDLADHSGTVTTTATGQTEGKKVAVGASIGLSTAVDTVSAEIGRDIDAGGAVGVEAKSTAKSSTTATASVKGGQKADAKDQPPPASSSGSTPGKSVDEQVSGQGTAAKNAGSKADAGAATKLDTADKAADKPKAETSEGGVSVAAAIGINVGVATTEASIAKGSKIKSGGATSVKSSAQMDASAKADGSQTNSGDTDVGVGAAVALNTAVATNRAVIGDNAEITAKGVTVSAVMPVTGTTTEKNDFSANAKSGAGAGNVGVAGSLAVNVVVATTEAVIEGDKDTLGAGLGHGAKIDAGGGNVTLEARNYTTNTVTSGADVKTGSNGEAGTVGVGASIGVNVVVNTARAEAEDKSTLIHGDDVSVTADAKHVMSTTVTGGAAGAKVSITPVAAVSVDVNTTTARLGESASDLDMTGDLAVHATQTNTVTTKATGQAVGDVAVGASLAAAVSLDHVSAVVDRNISASSGIDLAASSETSIKTEAKAGAKGAKAAAKNPTTGKEEPAAGTTVDEQKDNQLKSAASKNTATNNTATKAAVTKTPEAKAPDTNKDETGTNKESGKKVSVAAAIGVSVAENQATATSGVGRTLKTSGKLGIKAVTGTNYNTVATGEAVSDNVGIAAAVAVAATRNKTQATLGADSTVVAPNGNITILATAEQNRDAGFLQTMSAEATSGASGGDVAVAGSLAVVLNDNQTRASIDEGATIGASATPVGDILVKAEDTSKIAARARAGALSKGSDSKAGVGASFAVLLANNATTASVGYDVLAADHGSNIFADSLTVQAIKNRIDFTPLKLVTDFKNSDFFDKLDPTNYLNQVNYYTEAVAGAAAKGDAAVSGAFAVNVFGNTTEATINNANVTTGGVQAGGSNGVQVSSSSDTNALAIGGAVAGAKKAGVGITNVDIVNGDQVLASVSGASKLISNSATADVKVSADSKQEITNVSVSGAAATQGSAVGGVLGVIVSLNKSDAEIGDGSSVSSQGNVSVTSSNDSTMVLVSGGVAAGKEVGVGGAVAANIIKNETYASIGKNAEVNAKKAITVSADADEVAVAAVVAGAGGGKVGVAAALSLNTILSDTQASVGEGAKLNTDEAFSTAEKIAISAHDDTVITGVAGGGAGGGKVGVGAAIDTTVLVKTVKAFIADDTLADGKVATLKAAKEVSLDAASSETLVSVSMGFGGGGTVGVGGAVSVAVNKNDVQAYIGKSATVDSNGNVLVNAQDDVTAVLTAGAAAGGGNTGVGASLAVATLLESSKAYIGDGATVNARGNADAATVISGDTVFTDPNSTPTALGAKKTESAKGLSITAYNRENLITTVVGGAGGGTAGVAATVSANVIASNTEASIGQGASINADNSAAGADQQVRVKAVDEALLINTAGAGAGGGTAGVGAAANVGVIAKTTTAKIGKKAMVKATKAIELDAASSDISVTTTAGFAGGGSAGVGGAVAGVGVANITQAYVEDGAAAAEAAKLKVSSGDLALNAKEFSSSWLVTGAGGGGGAAGVGGSLAAGVNASTTKARIGDYAETNASGTTSVHADSVENVNTVTVAGAGGGSAGVAGAISVNVIVARTEAGIGKHAKVNQDFSGQYVDVNATDKIISVGAAGAAAGGGAAGVGGSANVTVALNTTSAYIDNDATVSAAKDVKVNASSEKYVNSATFSGAGGGAAGVAGAVSVISVGSLLDGEAKSGLSPKDDSGNTSTTQSQSDGQLNKSAVGDMLGDSAQSKETKGVLDAKSGKLAVGQYMADSTPIPLKNTQAFIGQNATVKAGENLTLTAADKTLAIVGAGAGAGGGAAGVSGSLGVVLLHDSAEAFIADGAKVDAGKTLSVSAQTSENVFNVGITGGGAGAADVSGSLAATVVSSDTAAYIGAAQVNKDAVIGASSEQSVAVSADSDTNIVTVAANGGGAGAASVGGVLNVNTLIKNTRAYIGEGANVAADKNISISADSAENIIAGGIAIHGAGAAAVSGVVAVNVIANKTEAFIGASRDDSSKTAATVDSDGNVTLSAVDDSLVVAVSGAGNGAGAAGVGVNIGANVVSSQTRAYVADNSVVNARGNAAATDVYSGVIDNSTPAAMPTVDGVGDGKISNKRDGTSYGNVSGGASFNLKADGGGSGDASSTVNPSAQGSGNKTIDGASGGMGTKAKRSVKGLAVQAMGNEKMITATIGIAGAGAAAVTGAATVDVIASVTEASIGDGARINMSGAVGADPSVRVGAADNTFMVQTGATISGAGAAAVSGSVNTAVVAKTTTASIGDADVKANNIEVAAAASEKLYTVTANVSIAGAAGVGAAVGVDVVTNTTTASVGSGANLDATGDLNVHASQDTAVDIYTVAGAGGIAGVSGALSVAVVDNTTIAYVGNSAVLNAAGTTGVNADSREDITSVTVSAAGGGVGVAGAVGVKVVKSDTEAYLGQGVLVNQTRHGTAQDVMISASDEVKLSGGGGSGAVGAFAGAGATADVNIIRNTTTAYIGDSSTVSADRDISVTANSLKNVQSAAAAAAGGGTLGIGGAVSVVTIGARLDDDSQNNLKGSSGGQSGDTASYADSKISEDKVSGQLGNAGQVQMAKTKVSGSIGGLAVKSDMNATSASSVDKTQAYIGNGSTISAGHDIKVAASETLKVDVNAVGAAGGYVGIGGAVGVVVANSTTEAFIGSSTKLDAGNNVNVEASSGNVDSNGSRVRTEAGAGGVVGLSAAISVSDDSSTTRAYVDSSSQVRSAKALSIKAGTKRKAQAETIGATVGALAIGASVARAEFTGSTSAYLGDNAQVGKSAGKTVDDVLVSATDESTAIARATAGTAGILAGSGADARATVGSQTLAAVGNNVAIELQDELKVSASATPQAEASALGINIGVGAVGASLANARSNAGVTASLGTNDEITAVRLEVLATHAVGTSPSALAHATGASGGLLLGANATVATAESVGVTSALVGDDSTLAVSGTSTVKADNKTQQTSSGEGLSFGFVAVGADFSHANSSTLTQAVLGDNVKVTGATLQVQAVSNDANYAYGVAGSGGVASAPFSEASTSNNSQTFARTGSGNNTSGNARKIDVTNLLVTAEHDARFDSWIDSTNASLIGVSGAKAFNSVNTQAEAHIGTSGYVESDNITMQAHNSVFKQGPASGKIPGLFDLHGVPVSVPAWNVSSSSGGLADLPAAGSTTTIVDNALVQVGAGAHLEQSGSTSSPGVFRLDAWNEVIALDRVKLSSGGAISAASGKSAVLADVNNATVRVGVGAEVSSVGDMMFGARSLANISTQTAVDVYGLVGVAPYGESISRFLASNTVDIGATAKLDSMRDIKLSAGANSVDAGNNLVVGAHTDVYNNTVIPISQDPVADAIINTQSQINIGSAADVGAARHIMLYGEDGTASASGVGVGKDIYREALAKIASAISNAFGGGDVSFETRTGRSLKTQVSDVYVNGNVHVGTQRKQELEIAIDGTASKQTSGISITGTGFKDIAADIQKRITDLNKLINDYTVSDATADASIAVAAYKSEIEFLRRKLKDIGISSGEVSASPYSAMDMAKQSLSAMKITRASYDSQKTTLTTQSDTLTIQNGTLTTQNGTLKTQYETIENVTNKDLQTQIDALDPVDDAVMIIALQKQISDNAKIVEANKKTIEINEKTIDANGKIIEANTPLIASLGSDIDRLDAQSLLVDTGIKNKTYSETPAGGPLAKFLTISDVTAQLGNIYVRGKSLRGTGILDAPGDAEIKITNYSPSFLVLKNLTIPADEGGKLYFNGVDVKNNTQINNVNGSAGVAALKVFTAESAVDSSGNPVTASKPQIIVQSNYDPLDSYYTSRTPANVPRLAPDLILQGDVNNPRGLVKIDSAAGSIRLEQKRDASDNIISPAETASIHANDVEIKTRNGDFVQSYTDTFFHTAGAPLTVIPGDPNLPVDNVGRIDKITQTPEVSGKGIIANGSVLIAARYLNINGIIQSGISEWGVQVTSGATVTIPGNANATFAQAQAYYSGLSAAQKAALGAEYFQVSGASVSGLAGNTQGNWEKIKVNYNARENRLELGGVQVQGGYIELFGQIFNTNPNGSSALANLAGGQLRVMDGYGKISVDNQTSLPLWVNTLDTGRGVKGEVNITNISGLDANGVPVFTRSTFTRDEGESRTGYTYNPQSDLRYAMSVGSVSGRVDNYRYSTGAIIGIPALPTQLDQYWLSGLTLNNDPIKSHGEFVGLLPSQHGNVDSSTMTKSSTSQPVLTNSWFDCNWWTLCAYGTYYMEFNKSTTTKAITTASLKADNPIQIKYIGFDQGSVNINSSGSVVFNSAVNNRNGNTTVTSAGSISQSGEVPVVTGNNIALSAGSGIGSAAQALQVNVSAGGKLDASSNSGEIHASQMIGDLKVGTIGGSGVTNVVLEADRSILSWNSASYVEGQRVELTSQNGSIGTLSDTTNDPLLVRTGYTSNQAQWPNYGLKATARDNINLKNTSDSSNTSVYSGNLLLISAESKAGDVRIETTGKVIDNNPYSTTDTRTEAELANLWDSLRLRGGLATQKANEAVLSYQKGKNANYTLYWKMRSTQADGGATYSPDYHLTASERTALGASGMTATQIDELEAGRKAQYQQLDAEVGGLTTSYSASYSYALTAAEEASIRKGSSWSDSQLALSVGAGLLKNITDTVTTIKQANAKGRNVTLLAGTDIGSYNDPLVIDLSAGLAGLSQDKKAALAAAERGDAILSGNTITIVQPRPVNVSVGSGALNATATTGYALIGSEQDLRIDKVTAADDVRIKAAGSLINAASVPGEANVSGDDVILEAANGGIGSLPDADGAVSTPLRLNVSGNVIARAASDIWLEAQGDLKADTIYSRNDLRLVAQGSILDAHSAEVTDTPDNNLRARNITLTATTGSIGVSDNLLDTGVNKDGAITATAASAGQGVYLNGPSGEYFNIASVTAGGPVTLSSVGDAVVTGITSRDPTENAISITSTKGRILAGHTLGSGQLDIVADAAPDSKLTLWAKLGIGDEPLNVRLSNLKATSGGIVDIAAQDSINIDSILAGDRVLLSATGNITGNSVTSDGTGSTNPDKSIAIASSAGGVTLASVSGQTAVSVSGMTGVDVGTLSVGTNLNLTGPQITASVNGGAGTVSGSVSGFAGGVANNVNLTLSGPGGFSFGKLWSAAGSVSIPLGSFAVDSMIVLDRATVINPQTRLLVDQHVKSIQAYDVQLYSNSDAFSITLDGNRVKTSANVIHSDPMHEVITPSGSDSSADKQGDAALAKVKQSPPELPPGNSGSEGGKPVELISFTGAPVSMDCTEGSDCE